jgi:hypothetical protein
MKTTGLVAADFDWAEQSSLPPKPTPEDEQDQQDEQGGDSDMPPSDRDEGKVMHASQRPKQEEGKSGPISGFAALADISHYHLVQKIPYIDFRALKVSKPKGVDDELRSPPRKKRMRESDLSTAFQGGFSVGTSSKQEGWSPKQRRSFKVHGLSPD